MSDDGQPRRAVPSWRETALAEDFLSNYHRYTDSLYRCFMESQHHGSIAATNFRFDLYASGEYSRMLETQWAGE